MRNLHKVPLVAAPMVADAEARHDAITPQQAAWVE
jgi:hypothetical protein